LQAKVANDLRVIRATRVDPPTLTRTMTPARDAQVPKTRWVGDPVMASIDESAVVVVISGCA